MTKEAVCPNCGGTHLYIVWDDGHTRMVGCSTCGAQWPEKYA